MNDNRMDQIIAKLLRSGVAGAAIIVAAGGIWYLAQSGAAPAEYRHFHPDPHALRSLELLSRPQLVILIGLLILIATPIARVIFSLVAFSLERDRVFVWITAAVLAILLYSLAAAWW